MSRAARGPRKGQATVRYAIVSTYDVTAIQNMVLYGHPNAGTAGVFIASLPLETP